VGTIASADNSVPGTQPPVTPEGLADALRQAEEDPAVRAVVLEVNSPGGGTTASDEMHQSILDFRESSGKPVVVSMQDTAASGGYYISTAADRIVANETTLTGSLGVIFQLNNFTELAEKYGYQREIIKSGEFKDIANSFRELSPEDREILQSIVNESYDEFVSVIVEGRNLPEERVREIADGRVYSGLQAREIGLVDSFGGVDEAAEISQDLAGVDEATVVRYVQPETFTDALLASFAPDKPDALQIAEEVGMTLEPKPYYLYLPGA
jgi:protease-4